jgi:hypothetical protein
LLLLLPLLSLVILSEATLVFAFASAFAFAVVVVLAFLVVIPEGDLLLSLLSSPATTNGCPNHRAVCDG